VLLNTSYSLQRVSPPDERAPGGENEFAAGLIKLLCKLNKPLDDVQDKRNLTMVFTYRVRTVRCAHPHSAHPRASCSLVCSALAASLCRKIGFLRRRSSGG
jgi:hypothetical protein